MHRKERRLGEEADRHEGACGDGRDVGTDPSCKENDIERPVGPVEQGCTEKIERRAHQGEDQVAQRGRKSLGLPAETDQRDGGERQEFKRDIEVEQVIAEQHRIHCAPKPEQHRPEYELRSGLAAVGRIAAELCPGVERRRADNDAGGDQHRSRDPVRAQRHSERGSPTAELIDKRRAAIDDPPGNGHGHGDSGRHRQQGDARGLTSAQRKGKKGTGHRQHQGKHEQEAASRRSETADCVGRHGCWFPEPGFSFSGLFAPALSAAFTSDSRSSS